MNNLSVSSSSLTGLGSRPSSGGDLELKKRSKGSDSQDPNSNTQMQQETSASETKTVFNNVFEIDTLTYNKKNCDQQDKYIKEKLQDFNNKIIFLTTLFSILKILKTLLKTLLTRSLNRVIR